MKRGLFNIEAERVIDCDRKANPRGKWPFAGVNKAADNDVRSV